MNKDRFLKELEELLSDVPYGEKYEALQYYEAYFDDAGIENEERIIRELGSPAKVAQTIKESLFGEAYKTAGEFSETGYTDDRFEEKNEVRRRNSFTDFINNNNSVVKIVLLIILCIVAIPAVFGLFGGTIGVVFGFGGVIFGLVMAIFGLSIGALVAGVRTALAGISGLALSTSTGLFSLGVGILLVAIGMTMTWLLVWVITKVIPWLFRTVVDLFRNLLKGKKVNDNENIK